MTIELAEKIMTDMKTEVKVAYSHRFAGDSGTILRLDNYAMINIFDDGRYYIQGDNKEALIEAFTKVEPPWDPETFSVKPILPWLPMAMPSKPKPPSSEEPPKRF
jgi:hypothetical protein